MKPGKLNLPPIWRGCVYPRVNIIWQDDDGNPIDLTGWTPRAYSREFPFHTEVLDDANGVTALSLPLPATVQLKKGIKNWDWIWTEDDTPKTVSKPMLGGCVEVREPVTDPATHVAGRIGGGSNYIKMFVKDALPDIFISMVGRYHQTFAPAPQTPVPIAALARDQMAQMIANGQTKITILIGFWHSSLDLSDPEPVEYIYGAGMIPFHTPGGRDNDFQLTPQQQTNLLALLQDIKDAGFTELNIRFQVFGHADTYNWPNLGPAPPHPPDYTIQSWQQDRYEQNKSYILSIIFIIEANRGEFPVIYDLGTEFANNRLQDTKQAAMNVHRQYCRFLWAAYVNLFGPNHSVAFSILGAWNSNIYPGKTPLGLGAMLDLFKHNNPRLPYPGYYSMDLYDRKNLELDPGISDIHDMLVDSYDYIKANYHPEELKPFILQETVYNDNLAFIQVERALGERRQLNLHSIYQWPTLRGHRPPNHPYIFPDGYPVNFDAYHTL